MRTRIKLNQGEELKLEASRSKGTMAETDIYQYSVIDKAGNIVGSIEHTDHASLNGFKRAQHVTQKCLQPRISRLQRNRRWSNILTSE